MNLSYIWHHWNLYGICTCFGLVLIMPVAGLIGGMIERSKTPRWRKKFGATTEFAGVLWKNLGRVPQQETAATPPHVHIIDATRTEITLTEIGGIHARCVVAGCNEAVYIAPGVLTPEVASR